LNKCERWRPTTADAPPHNSTRAYAHSPLLWCNAMSQRPTTKKKVRHANNMTMRRPRAKALTASATAVAIVISFVSHCRRSGRAFKEIIVICAHPYIHPSIPAACVVGWFVRPMSNASDIRKRAVTESNEPTAERPFIVRICVSTPQRSHRVCVCWSCIPLQCRLGRGSPCSGSSSTC